MSEQLLSTNLLDALKSLVQTLNERKIDYALVDGLAVAVRGVIRATRDIDMTLTIPALELPGVLESLQQKGFDLDLRETISEWTNHHMVNFLCGDVRVDWLKTILPSFQSILRRAQWEQLFDTAIRVADAEGLILLKLIAFRPRDQEDIQGLISASSGSLDLDWIRQQWATIAGQDDVRARHFEDLLAEFG